MVHRRFQNLDIDCWIHDGKLGVSQPSVCFSHVAPRLSEACGAILLALDELHSDGPPAKRTLTFKPTSRRTNISTCRLSLLAESEQLRVLNISCESASCAIDMTVTGSLLLRDAIVIWRDGGEDFGISS